jgi:Ca-activated chloride channel family protein
MDEVNMAAQCKFFLRNYQVALFWIVFTRLRVMAQTDLNEVHVLPPAAARPSAENSGNQPVIRKSVDLVLVPVTITDKMNQMITGLDKENFKLYENKREQPIEHFSSEDAPVSIGIILDTSTSMNPKINRAQEAVREFCKAANPEDEYFLITFADQPNAATQFISDPEEFQRQLVYAVPHGKTALLDAVYLGLQKMDAAKHPRRALLIISDGGDNHSRYTEHEVVSQVKESNVAVYAIGIYDHSFPTEEELLGPRLLSTIAQVSGGRAFSVDDPNDLPAIASKVGEELRNQYVLGYRPQDMQRDGKWHNIRVKLQGSRRWSFLNVHARTGYYAPKQ